MLDSDIDTFPALAHLSIDDATADEPTRGGFSRRRFLQMAAMAGGTAAFASALPVHVREAFAAAPIGPNDGILVIVLLGGGNDGLNTFVPYTDGAYYDARGDIAIAAVDVLGLDGSLGVNPKLPFVKSEWDAGRLAVVEGLGYDNPDLSHFSSMAKWMSGYPTGAPSSGWLGRWLDARTTPEDAFDALALSNSVPLHVVGASRRATGVRASEYAFGIGDEPQDLRLGTAVENFALAPPDGELVRELTVAARLINADIGVRVVAATLGDFDHHAGQNYAHPLRMELLNAGLEAFYGTLDPAFASRVTLMTFAEFGRRVPRNESGGTDHGTANAHMVIGPQVQGGLYGQRPSLTDLDDEGCPTFTVDFRSLYATMIDGWLGGDATAVLGGTFEPLPLFRAGPGT
jgi:uncharacterized protein (DUF1501 family)